MEGLFVFKWAATHKGVLLDVFVSVASLGSISLATVRLILRIRPRIVAILLLLGGGAVLSIPVYLNWKALGSFAFDKSDNKSDAPNLNVRMAPACEPVLSALRAMLYTCNSYHYALSIPLPKITDPIPYDQYEGPIQRRGELEIQCEQHLVAVDKAEAQAKPKLPESAKYQLGFVTDAMGTYYTANDPAIFYRTTSAFEESISGLRKSCREEVK